MLHEDHDALWGGFFVAGWVNYISPTGGAITELPMHFVLCHSRGWESLIRVSAALSDPSSSPTPARNLTVFLPFWKSPCLAPISVTPHLVQTGVFLEISLRPHVLLCFFFFVFVRGTHLQIRVVS